jgi:hypothetical protein
MFETSALGKSPSARPTIADVVAHVLDVFDLRPSDLDLRRARRAAREAVATVAQRHAWRHSHRRDRITMNAPYATGTVSVSGDTVTLSGGVWPSWASMGVLSFGGDGIMDGRGWRIRERVSDTVVSLESSNPTALSGVTYRLVHTSYPSLPGMRILRRVYNATMDQPVALIPTSELHTRQLWDETTPSDIRIATIETNYVYGDKFLVVSPPPNRTTVLTVDAVFDAAPAERVIRAGSDVGLVAISGGVATFSGVSVPEGEGDMMLFVSGTSAAPTPDIGWGSQNYVPVAANYRVRRRITPATVELYDATGVSVTARGFVLADIIQYERHVFLAILKYAESIFARMTMRKNWMELEQYANQELLYAMEQDIPIEKLTYRDALNLRTGHIISQESED